MSSARQRSVFIVRLKPGMVDALPEAMATNELILGWSKAEGLLNPKLTWDTFRRIVKDTYDYVSRQAAAEAGSLWTFLRKMQKGDLVVVPHGDKFYVAEVVGDAYHVPQKVPEDRAHRRPAKWLNDYRPFNRGNASSPIRKALRAWQTCTRADHLYAELRQMLGIP